MIDRSSPVAVLGGLTFATLSAGYWHTCGLTTSGAAYCWGSRLSGQLGDGTDPTKGVPSPANLLSPAPVLGGLTFGKVSAAAGETCGVTPGAAAYCWGSFLFDNVTFNGSANGSSTPVAVSGGLSIANVSAGSGTTCEVTTVGAAYCWGGNYYGELGDGRTGNGNALLELNPQAVLGGLTFATVSTGSQRTCGVTTGGAAYCWGRNVSGWLGVAQDPLSQSVSIPTPVLGGLTFVMLSTAIEEPFTCAVTASGAAYCWGVNGTSPNIVPTASGGSASPVAISGGLSFVAVSAGGAHACGVTAGGAIYCWGNNSNGQLGGSTLGAAPVPVSVASPR
jgi:alpha-tubulin suppressor-like RCC1 family protein